MLLQILQLILSLSILVILHELGHFLPAKWFKTKIEKFYLFFDPWFCLVKKKIGETEYGIGWLPLGGYVKIAGMIDENMDSKQLKNPPQSWEYRSKKNWQKLIIILGGVIINFFFAWFLFIVIFTFYGYRYQSTKKYQENGLSFNQAALDIGFENKDKIISIDGKPIKDEFNNAKIDLLFAKEILVERNRKKVKIKLSNNSIKKMFSHYKENLVSPYLNNIIVDSVLPNTFAKKYGLMKNDTIIKINDKNIISFPNFQQEILKFSRKTVKLEIKRNDKSIFLFSPVSEKGTLGFFIKKMNLFSYNIIDKVNFLESIPKAWHHIITILNYQIIQFKLIFQPDTGVYKQTMGPLRMFKIFSPSWDWILFWNMLAILSIWLSFVNLLPIPGLDGGHAMFIIAEIITNKQVTGKIAETIHKIGFILIFLLMIFVFSNDIWHIIQEIIK